MHLGEIKVRGFSRGPAVMGTEVGSLNHGDANSQIPLTQLPASRTPLLGIKGKLIPVNYPGKEKLGAGH